MNDTKIVGRPRKFDKDEALLAAVNVFWEKGYDGASMKDLTEGMGINSPSLYSAFGDKHNLYLQAIDRYISNDGCAPMVAFESEPDIRTAVRGFFKESIEYATEQGGSRVGCFLSSCVSTSAGEVAGVQELLKRSIEETDTRLTRRFEQAKAEGSLREDFPSLERARLMFDLRQGFILRARAGLSCDIISAASEHYADIVLRD